MGWKPHISNAPRGPAQTECPSSQNEGGHSRLVRGPLPLRHSRIRQPTVQETAVIPQRSTNLSKTARNLLVGQHANPLFASHKPTSIRAKCERPSPTHIERHTKAQPPKQAPKARRHHSPGRRPGYPAPVEGSRAKGPPHQPNYKGGTGGFSGLSTGTPCTFIFRRNNFPSATT